MMYTLTAIAILAAILFQARGMLAQRCSEAKMRADDFDGALRRLRWISLGIPNVFMLHKGHPLIDLGRCDEAEQCYHRAIEGGDDPGSSQDGLAELLLAHA
jgi:hypothetical protein